MKRFDIEEIDKRIAELEIKAKPDEIATGMTGSFIAFCDAIELHNIVSDEDYETYLPYVYVRFDQVYDRVNGETEHMNACYHTDFELTTIASTGDDEFDNQINEAHDNLTNAEQQKIWKEITHPEQRKQ